MLRKTILKQEQLGTIVLSIQACYKSKINISLMSVTSY
jgi:hypothetical protein